MDFFSRLYSDKEDDFYNYLSDDEKKTYSKEEVAFYLDAAKRTSVIAHIMLYASLYMILFCSLLILLKITLIPAKLNALKYIFPSVNYYIQAGQNHIASTHSIFFLMIIGVTVYVLRQCPFRFKVFFANFSSFFIMKTFGIVMMVVLTIFAVVFYVPMENTCYQSEYYNRGCLGRDATKDSVYFNLFFFFHTCLSYFFLLLIVLAIYAPKELRVLLGGYLSSNPQAVLDERIHGGIAPKQLYRRVKKWIEYKINSVNKGR